MCATRHAFNPFCSIHLIKTRRAKQAKPLFKQLQWLPIEQRIKYKTACLCCQIIISTAPQYLDELVQIYIHSRYVFFAVLFRMITINPSPSLNKNSMAIVFACLLLLCCRNLEFSPFFFPPHPFPPCLQNYS